jgi:hypothetical protein
MQRTAQRENAFHATINPYSSSDSSTLRGLTRCDEDTMAPDCGARAGADAGLLRGIGAIFKSLMIR